MSTPFNRAFTALFTTQFLGAFNDNLFKSALLVFIAFHPSALGVEQVSGAVLGAIAAGLFILPFFLFSAVAGEISDCSDQAAIAKIVKTVEILLMIGAGAGFLLQNLPLLLLVLFGTGAQSAFFGPVKYAIIPRYVHADALISANGWIETATFMAILLGTITGGLLAGIGDSAAIYCSALLVCIAIFGRVAATYMPAAPALRQDKPILNPFIATPHVLRHALAEKKACKSIPYISWFWFLGATYLAQMPFFVKDITYGDSHTVTLFLAIFSLGIAIGSLACEKITKQDISLKAAPVAALVMGAGALLLYIAGGLIPSHDGISLLTPLSFITDISRALMLVSVLMIAIAGGVYIVPLYAMMQFHSSEDKRSIVIATNNIVNAFAMTISALFAAGLASYGIKVDLVFFIAGVGNIFIAFILYDKTRP